MAVHAYVLIRCTAGRSKQVVEELRGQEHVVRANTVFGDYDVIVRLRIEDLPSFFSVQRLEEIVIDEIQNVKGVMTTKTLIVTSIDPKLET
jgi:DNA-binding Lrp family transcriptional regulator